MMNPSALPWSLLHGKGLPDARQNGMIIPGPISGEGATFISKNICPLTGLKEKRNPIEISLNVSSLLDCKSLNVVFLASSK